MSHLVAEVTVSPARGKEVPVASIIILTLNQLDYTRQCIDSIFEHSTLPFELIVVDNGSTDATRAYMEALAERDERVRLVFNPYNTGFAYGCNQGAALSRGELVVFLNNDTVVTAGWLEGLVAPMLDNPLIGAVGPRTNNCAPPQRLESVPYGEDMTAMAEFARARRQEFSGKGIPLTRLIGFCLAVRRAVLEMIGGFDTRFGVGNFEDDDLCIRIQRAGFGLWVADDVYVHHWLSKTFRGERVDYERLMKGNVRIFLEKWDMDPENPPANWQLAEVLALPPLDGRDVFPLVCSGAPTWILDCDKSHRFLLCLDGTPPARLELVLQGFASAFNSSDDVALLLWSRMEDESALAKWVEMLEPLMGRVGLSRADAPEVVLVPARDHALNVGRILRMGHTWVAHADARLNGLAKEAELHCLDGFSTEAWRLASRQSPLPLVPLKVEIPRIPPERRIAFITCVDDDEAYKRCAQAIRALETPQDVLVEVLCMKDARSMATSYNVGMKHTPAKYKVYLRQDTVILNSRFIYDLIVMFESHPELGLLGVVGTETLPFTQVRWNDATCYGRVQQPEKEVMFNEVTQDYQPVEAVDGVIMITQYDLPWNEGIPGFQLFDAAHSCEFRRAGYQVGIPRQEAPWVMHPGGGKWQASAEQKGFSEFQALYGEASKPQL